MSAGKRFVWVLSRVALAAACLCGVACDHDDCGEGASGGYGFGDAAAPSPATTLYGSATWECSNGGVPPDCVLVIDAGPPARRRDGGARRAPDSRDGGGDAGIRRKPDGSTDAEREADVIEAPDAGFDAGFTAVGLGARLAR